MRPRRTAQPHSAVANLGALPPRRNSLDPLGEVVDGPGGSVDRVVCLALGSATAAPLLRQGLVGVRQLVGDDERGEQQQPSLADLPDVSGELADPGIDILRKPANARLLAVIAGDLIRRGR